MSEFVLVTGATGQQGGAVARALLTRGIPVHALVRTPGSSPAKALATLGAELVHGDLDDPASLARALDGARGLFSVQTLDPADPMGDTEVRHARHLADAARASGVGQIVHTSVSGATRPVDEDRWGAFLAHYYRGKTAAEQAVRDAGVEHLTIIRPAAFMENFARPSFYFADETSDHLLVAVDPDVVVPFVAVADVGAPAAAAFADPGMFDGVELELAGDRTTFRGVATLLTDVLGTPITLPAGPAQARADGLPDAVATAEEFLTGDPAPARPEFARALGLPTTSFEDWARTTLGSDGGSR